MTEYVYTYLYVDIESNEWIQQRKVWPTAFEAANVAAMRMEYFAKINEYPLFKLVRVNKEQSNDE